MGYRDFDASKDKCIKQYAIINTPDGTLEIGVYQYNNGPKKLRMVRKVNGKNGNVYPKSLVNLDAQEFAELRKHLESAEEELGL